MYKLIDKNVILILCSFTYFIYGTSETNVIFILIALICGNACGYFENPMIRYAILVCYFIYSIFFLEACFFIPFLLYDSFFNKENNFLIVYIIPLIIHYNRLNSIYIVGFILLTMCCFYLRYKTRCYIDIVSQNKKIKDDSEELKLLQEHKHRELLERQDYEIQLAKSEERNRIAREIHDSVGHNLSSSLLQIGAMIALNQDENLKNPLQNMKETLSDGMNSIRNSVHNLHEDNLNLKEEMEKLVKQFNKCEVSLQFNSSNFIDLHLKYCFINILKEALNNVNKHSNCTKVDISFIENPSFYQFTIHDNGNKITIKDGLGLKSMYERVHAFQGFCNISSEQGFHIFINIPKKATQVPTH